MGNLLCELAVSYQLLAVSQKQLMSLLETGWRVRLTTLDMPRPRRIWLKANG
jgi:hypothetical protein